MKYLLMLFVLAGSLSATAQKWAKNFDFVDQCICGLSLVGKDHKYGYVDRSGNIIVAIIFDEGLTFKEGYSAVRKGEKWQYIDSSGSFITDPVFSDAQSFYDGFAAVMEDNHLWLYQYQRQTGY